MIAISPDPFDHDNYPYSATIYVRSAEGDLLRFNARLKIAIHDDDRDRIQFIGTNTTSMTTVKTAKG